MRYKKLKTFENQLVQLPILSRIDGVVRKYRTPENNSYPSMTTMLKLFDDGGLDKWVKFVSVDKAEKIKNNAAKRGDLLHKMCEEYLLNKLNMSLYDARLKTLFRKIQTHIDEITLVNAIELTLYSDKYKIAGTVDCIAYYRSVLSIIDFKGSNKVIDIHSTWGRKKLFKYFVQCAGYQQMFLERTNKEAKNLIIIASIEETRKSQIFIAPAKPFIKEFELLCKAYYTDNKLILNSNYWKL